MLLTPVLYSALTYKSALLPEYSPLVEKPSCDGSGLSSVGHGVVPNCTFLVWTEYVYIAFPMMVIFLGVYYWWAWLSLIILFAIIVRIVATRKKN